MRYADFFKESPEFLQLAVGKFFSAQGIRHRETAIAASAINMFMRLTEKIKRQATFTQQGLAIAQQLVSLIEDSEQGKLPTQALGADEIQNLYYLIGVVSSIEALAEEQRVQLLQWALTKQT